MPTLRQLKCKWSYPEMHLCLGANWKLDNSSCCFGNHGPTSASLNNGNRQDRLKAGVVQNTMQKTANGWGKSENAPQKVQAKESISETMRQRLNVDWFSNTRGVAVQRPQSPWQSSDGQISWKQLEVLNPSETMNFDDVAETVFFFIVTWETEYKEKPNCFVCIIQDIIFNWLLKAFSYHHMTGLTALRSLDLIMSLGCCLGGLFQTLWTRGSSVSSGLLPQTRWVDWPRKFPLGVRECMGCPVMDWAYSEPPSIAEVRRLGGYTPPPRTQKVKSVK